MNRLLALGALAALVAAACGGSAQQARSDAPAGRVIEINMQAISFAPRTLTLTAGERVTLRLINPSNSEHEFMAGRSAQPRTGGFREDFLTGVQVDAKGLIGDAHSGMGHAGVGLRVAAGKTAEASFDVPLKSGTYEFGCFVPGHYEAGMKGILVVE